jgi:HEAT repeat protein
MRRTAVESIANIFSPDGPPMGEPVPAKLDEPTTKAMIKATKDVKSLVRVEAIQLLGETRDAKFENIFTTALNDQSYLVIENAAVALGNAKSPKAYDSLIKLTTAKSWREHYKIAGLRGLGGLGDKRAFDTAYKLATDKMQDKNVRSAALVVVASSGKGDARAYPLIKKGFDSAFAAQDFQGIFDSIQAIIDLADPRGQEVFDAMKAKFKDNPQFMGFITELENQFKEAIKK